MRWHAGAGRVERQLAERNAHTARAKVAKTQNAFAVGHDDKPHIPLRPVAEDLLHPAARSSA